MDQNPAPKIERVAAYIRVSTQEQKLHGYSLDAQKMKLQQYADANNLKIVSWYEDEGVSGRKLIKHRPQLQAMIKDAQKGLFERIIFIKLDRFFRSVSEYHSCMKQIDPVIWTATEEQYDLNTANGRLLVNMKLTIAELEADQASERIRLVNHYKVRSGRALYGKGALPFGFTTKSIDGIKRVVKDPETKEAAEEIIRHFLQHNSKRATAIHINEIFGLNIDFGVVERLLKSELVCGKYRDNYNFCEGYIDYSTYLKIKKILESKNVKVNTAKNRYYIFTGLTRCPVCGSPLSGYISSFSQAGERRRYKRYRCQNHYRDKLCSFTSTMSESILEKKVLQCIEGELETQHAESVEIYEKAKQKVKPNIDEIYNQIDRLNYSWQTGKIKNVETYESRYKDLEEQLELCMKEMDDVKSNNFAEITELLSGDWKAVYEALTDEMKRSFWRTIIDEIHIDWDSPGHDITGITFI